MKRKILIGILLIIILLANLCKVQAYTGELDIKDYIEFSDSIYIQDKVGTGTVSLASSASSYSIYYQKVDITESTLNNITTKHNRT